MGKKYLIRCLCCNSVMGKDEDYYYCPNPSCGARFFKSIERQNFVYAEEDEDDWNGNPS